MDHEIFDTVTFEVYYSPMKYFLWIFLVFTSLKIQANSQDPLLKLIQVNELNSNYSCNETTSIDNQEFCLSESTITLNSCGKNTDLPCLEEAGCLKINRYVLIENE